MPAFGYFMVKILFAYNNPDLSKVTENVKWNCIYMVGVAVGSFIFVTIQKSYFGYIGENITLAMRVNLYSAIIKKHIGFFDKRDNSPGVLTSNLSSDAQELNGATTGGLATIAESMAGLLVGIVLGFIFSWRLALVAIGLTPFMAIGGALQGKMMV